MNFAFEQFVASVRHALFGRDKADETSACVAQWVLWGLAGQDQVHSSQLAIGVLDTLRRVDHIAYLRWASTAKSIDSVTLFRDEARGLLTNPSVPLVFDEKLSRPMPPSRR